MKLVASMITKNELGRYLPLVIEHLQAFCDEIRVLDDYSTDGTVEALNEWNGVVVQRNYGPTFDEHEGNARNELLRWTLLGKPTHVLAVDADEFVSDGQALRGWIEREAAQVYGIAMEEVWEANKVLRIRTDGGWRPHPIPILFTAPARMDRYWSIPPKKLACGREPLSVRNLWARGRAVTTDVSVLHFGWTREAERQRRFDRYMQLDGGKFHQGSHLASIMWPASRIILKNQPWPVGLRPLKERLLAVTSAR
jgi:hypothetical protein